MMSSVIPARLEFQCGHAALVSLPRVKGESPAQRTDRIAREKSAAQARSCDFCPPMEVAEVVQAVVVVAAQPAPAPVAPPAPPVTVPVVAPVVRHVPAVAPPVEPVVEPTEIVAETVAPVVLPVPPVTLPVAPVAAGTDATTMTTRRLTRPRRTPALAAPARNGRATSYRFVVRFRTEAVLNATDIRDALRQVELLGASEVLAVSRNM